jgi:hypothetical protein
VRASRAPVPLTATTSESSIILEEVQEMCEHVSVVSTASKRRCKATNKRGEPCAATVVGADGKCSAHSGRQDMRELGRRGGRRSPGGKQLPAGERESLREALRDGLDHDLVVAAVKQSLVGGSESARVAAVKFLADLELYRKDEKDEPTHQAEIAAASRKLDALIERYVYDAVRESDAGVARDSEYHSPMTRLIAGAVARAREGQGAELDARIEKIFADVANGLQLVGDASAEPAEQILGGLEEAGLLVRRHKVEEMAEQRAQERLAALKAEHGLTV